jgi:S-adenosylmethionine-dependent methyltransferase
LAPSITSPGAARFQEGAQKYAAYLETPEGRLRLDLAFANLQEFLPQATQPLRALDLGCGTGALGVRLAQLGFHVTLMDVTPEMLELAKTAAQAAGVAERIALTRGDAAQIATLFHPQSFDVILCHNVLEFVDDPPFVLRAAALALRNSTSILSVLVRNQPGEVLKAALLSADLAAAEQILTSEWADESLYGGKVRLFNANGLHAMLEAASLATEATRGVRVISDYLPPKISRTDEYAAIFELERKLGRHPEFTAMARYTQCLAHRADPVSKSKA